MISVELSELGPPAELLLTLDQGRALAASAIVTAAPSAYRQATWVISPAGKVGVARVGDIEIRVKPKVDIARLLFLVGYSQHGAAWQPDTVPVAQAADLIPVIAQALWRQTERAIHQGLLPGYIVVEESSPVLRGRLRESEQLHRHHGLPLPLEIRHDEFTTDIPENRILRTACERMLAVPGVDAESQRMLRRLLRDFADVTPVPRGERIPLWQLTRLNARYHAALRLAELVLRATSIEDEYGCVAANGFLLDMPKLFEDFVTVALREALVARYGGRVEDQVRSYFDLAGRVVLRPDIVWKKRGSAVAVIDAKYKAEKPAGYPNADLYQLLAYCTILDLPKGHLVYAKGDEDAAHHVVRHSGIEIICSAIDLDQEPAQLLSQMGSLAELIASDSADSMSRLGRPADVLASAERPLHGSALGAPVPRSVYLDNFAVGAKSRGQGGGHGGVGYLTCWHDQLPLHGHVRDLLRSKWAASRLEDSKRSFIVRHPRHSA